MAFSSDPEDFTTRTIPECIPPTTTPTIPTTTIFDGMGNSLFDKVSFAPGDANVILSTEFHDSGAQAPPTRRC